LIFEIKEAIIGAKILEVFNQKIELRSGIRNRMKRNWSQNDNDMK
jgi:hypothetical protein